MNHATLCILIDENSERILLGMKKMGFGKGKYNGFGGKPKQDETVEDAAIREVYEESGAIVPKESIEKTGELNFTFDKKPEWNQQVHVFIAKNWKGAIKESEEMKPEWFGFNDIPFDKMWNDDKHWLPLILKGDKIKADFTFGDDNETIINYKINKIIK